MPKLWVVAPVYNEAQSVRTFIAEWLPVVHAAVGDDFVFCLINDGSTDQTLSILRECALVHPQILIVDKDNSGHGQSCLHGYRLALEAGAAWVFQIDSDGQCEPAHFSEFWQARNDAPVHYGERKGREDGAVRRLISLVLSSVVFLLSLTWVRDANVPYRLMGRDALAAALHLVPDRFGLVNVLLALLQQDAPGIVWHRVRFRTRSGRQSPIRPGFFVRHALVLLRDYTVWMLALLRRRFPEGVARLARPVIALAMAWYLLAFPLLALCRAGVFVQYDWLEGVHLVQVHRVLAGLPLYGEPSLTYTPLLYGPLYPYVAAAFAVFFGESYTLLRLISLTASIGSGMLLWRLVRALGGSPGAAWLATGLFAGMYGVSGFFYDMARVDALGLFLILLCAWVVWHCQRGVGTVLLAACAAAAAVLTKQTTLAPVFFLILWSFFCGGSRGRRVSLLCSGAVLVSQIVPILFTEGRFYYYLYELPTSHHLEPELISTFFFKEFLPKLSSGFLIAMGGGLLLLRERQTRRRTLFCLGLLAALAVASLLPRWKIGGAANNLMPLAAGLALCCGLTLDYWRTRKGWLSTVAFVLLASFSAQLYYKPKKALRLVHHPETFVSKLPVLSGLHGNIFAPCDPYLAQLAGKGESAFWGALLDVFLTRDERSQRLHRELLNAFAEQRYDAVVLRESFFKDELFPMEELAASYVPIPNDAAAMQVVYVPRPKSGQ